MSAVLQAPRVAHGDRLFFSGMAILSIAVVVIGFSPTFYLRGSAMGPLSTALVAHGAVFTAWLVLFLVQTLLIAADRRALHRTLGVAGVALAVTMVLLGTLTAVDSLRHSAEPIPGLDRRAFFAVPMRNMLVFPILVAAAVWLRRDAQAHKRLMLLATISILDAAIARFPIAAMMQVGPPLFWALQDLMIVPGILYDLATRGRVHAAWWWGAGLMVGSQVVFLLISGTPLWFSFAELFLPAG